MSKISSYGYVVKKKGKTRAGLQEISDTSTFKITTAKQATRNLTVPYSLHPYTLALFTWLTRKIPKAEYLILPQTTPSCKNYIAHLS